MSSLVCRPTASRLGGRSRGESDRQRVARFPRIPAAATRTSRCTPGTGSRAGWGGVPLREMSGRSASQTMLLIVRRSASFCRWFIAPRWPTGLFRGESCTQRVPAGVEPRPHNVGPAAGRDRGCGVPGRRLVSLSGVPAGASQIVLARLDHRGGDVWVRVFRSSAGGLLVSLRTARAPRHGLLRTGSAGRERRRETVARLDRHEQFPIRRAVAGGVYRVGHFAEVVGAEDAGR